MSSSQFVSSPYINILSLIPLIFAMSGTASRSFSRRAWTLGLVWVWNECSIWGLKQYLSDLWFDIRYVITSCLRTPKDGYMLEIASSSIRAYLFAILLIEPLSKWNPGWNSYASLKSVQNELEWKYPSSFCARNMQYRLKTTHPRSSFVLCCNNGDLDIRPWTGGIGISNAIKAIASQTNLSSLERYGTFSWLKAQDPNYWARAQEPHYRRPVSEAYQTHSQLAHLALFVSPNTRPNITQTTRWLSYYANNTDTQTQVAGRYDSHVVAQRCATSCSALSSFPFSPSVLGCAQCYFPRTEI